MQLAKALSAIAAVTPEQFNDLRRHLDVWWIAQALEDTGTVSVRKRKLPSEQMIWLVLGMALMRNCSIEEVVSRLDLTIADKEPASKAAAMAGRQRLGAEPLQFLFEHSGRTWARRSAAEDTFFGLKVYGVDGTTLRVADTPQNAEHFGYTESIRGQSAYPTLRLVVLMALRSHIAAAAAFGPYKDGELHYARCLWDELEDDSVCIVDKGFFSAALLLQIAASGRSRHWLTRAKKNARYRVIKEITPGDAIVEMKVSPEARRKDPSLPEVWQMRAIRYQRKGFESQMLLTSMLDHAQFKAEHVIALYHERWEIELGYDELKTVVLDRQETIRSKSPQMVAQELWGVLTAYNLVRLEMMRVAELVGVPAVRISFVMTLHLARDQWQWAMLTRSVGAIPKRLQYMRSQLQRYVLPERRPERVYPRAVKIKMSNYPRKRRATTVK